MNKELRNKCERLARIEESTYNQTGKDAAKWNESVKYHKYWSFKSGFEAGVKAKSEDVEKWCLCENVIFADTEKWPIPMCHDCAEPFLKLIESVKSVRHYATLASHRLIDADNNPLSCALKVLEKNLEKFK